MENLSASQYTIATEPLQESSSELVLAPKDFFVAPIFAATKQAGPRQVTVRVNHNGSLIEKQYFMGGFHPLRPNHPPPALDVRHGRALFVLLSFRGREPRRQRDRDMQPDPRRISFSFHEFCRKYARTNGGRYARAIMEILAELTDSYIRVVDLNTNIGHTYRLIERLDIVDKPICRKDAALASSKQREFHFHGCYLSEELYELLNHIVELQHLKLDVFTSIRSPLAQSIYLYIPSRAHHHSESAPFEITLTNLLEQVSFPVPQHKSVRHKLFTQNRNPIIKQLDGLETLTGIFRVRLAETNDGLDWKLQAWVEQNDKKLKHDPRNSKLMSAFLNAGHTQQELDRRLAVVQPLSDYEEDLLKTATVEIEKNRRFFELAKALVGPTRFATLAAEAKNDALEGRKATKNPTARLIWRIMEFVSQKKTIQRR